MHADNFVSLVVHHNLVEGTLVAADESRLHRLEGGGVDIYITELLHRFLLCVTARADVRLREDCGCHELVVRFCWLIVEESLGQRSPLHQRHWRQRNAVGDVADGVNTVDVCLGVLIHSDVPACSCGSALASVNVANKLSGRC